MPVPSPGGQGGTRAQQIAYYATYLAKLPGTYKGTYKQYDGYSWAALYEAIAASDTTADPKQLADAVLGLEGAQSLGTGTAAAESGLGKFIKQTEAAAASTNFAAGVPGLSALAQFFGGSSAGWLLRTGEILLGIVLIAVGIARLTHAVPIATQIAKAVA